MRQRKVKNIEERMQTVKQYFLKDAKQLKGSWKSLFQNERNLFLELGCGKGNFILKQAQLHPENNYIGIEGQLSVVFRALQKLEDTTLSNVRFACEFVNRPEDFFANDELSGIYLNFSDPWDKSRHAHRRLTHRNYLRQYHQIIKPGGFLEIKTDNDSLFLFTDDEVREAASDWFCVEIITADLHRTGFEAKNVTTEYEDKFKEAGKNIHYIKLISLK